ncbi:response regulator transcription factor [Providencia rettgeri]|jgi:DNA-binding CsgD family transcriptional regulator|uniref:Response regulator FixJ n=2 Tax=Gammaproteobacteria TaxID=1236 RepID=W9V1Q3_9GAMM|nr:response regulator FixJ [Nitrincola nitratireducens]
MKYVTDVRLDALVAETIAAINTARFTPALMRLLNAICHYDNAVVLGYGAGKHPVYLYDSLETSRHLLFQDYLMNKFQQDPFYNQLLIRQEGVFNLAKLIQKNVHHEYLRQFYVQTGWKDELCITINLDHERNILIFLGITEAGENFTTTHIEHLTSKFSVIKALCQQHWRHATFSLSQSLHEISISRMTMRRYIDESLEVFAQTLLTKREQQVASLLVQGADSSEIAKQLGLSIGTIKNYRKRIYTQLRVNSISELFKLFLNHLITHSPD